MGTKVKLTWDNGALTELQRRTNMALFKMGTDIASRARANAPVLTGALRNDIRVEPQQGLVYIKAGSSRVPYARRREYENHKNPWSTHYMGRAFASMMASDWETKYFGEITNL